MLKTIKQFDWPLIISIVLLIGFGLTSLYSSSLNDDIFSNLYKQFSFALVGLIIMFILTFVDWRVFQENSLLILILYIICIAGLVGLFFFAPETRGIKGWYKIGPFNFDPIDVTKIILIIMLAKYFSKRHVEVYRIRHFLISGIYALIPFALIFFQPNLGSASVLVVLWVGMLIISGLKFKHFLIICLCGILILAMSWSFLIKDYQKERVLSFLNPQDPLGAGWSQNQAKIAIGSGGFWGQGIGKGSQTQYGFLPETQTDFIFASIAEETGLAGVFCLLGLFSILIWRIIKIAIFSKNNFPRLFATGLAIYIIFQLFIHIGMNLGLLPIIGISLPLVSYGGSGLIATLAGFGILQSIKINR